MDTILEKLEQLRKEKGLSVFKLTEQAGLSENTVYNWYKKKSQPTIYALKAVCDVLGVSLSYFLRKIRWKISRRKRRLYFVILEV